MPTKTAPLKPTISNEALLNAIRNDASLDYQRRIPVATKGRVSEQLDAL